MIITPTLLMAIIGLMGMIAMVSYRGFVFSRSGVYVPTQAFRKFDILLVYVYRHGVLIAEYVWAWVKHIASMVPHWILVGIKRLSIVIYSRIEAVVRIIQKKITAQIKR